MLSVILVVEIIQLIGIFAIAHRLLFRGLVPPIQKPVDPQKSLMNFKRQVEEKRKKRPKAFNEDELWAKEKKEKSNFTET